MGDINPYVFELVETLAAVGADWLAFEVIEAIRNGRPTGRLPASWGGNPRNVDAWEGESLSPQERQLIDLGTEPIPTNEQIEFAANYVAERLSEAIAMTEASLQNLDRIASTFPGRHIEIGDQRVSPLALGLEENDFQFTGAEGGRLHFLLSALNTSLKEWTASKRSEESE